MSGARLGLVILAVDDLPRSVDFYQGAFGWEIAVDVPVYVEFALPEGMRLGLYARDGFARNTGQPPLARPAAGTTATELYLYPADVELALARLINAGAVLLSPMLPRDWGDDAAYLADPDGNVLVVARPSDAGGGISR